MKTHYFYLIPGFFGFADLGGITYFHHVHEILLNLCRPHGIEPEIHYISTPPTASIRRRAHFLHDQILETATDPDAPIHLIGHSTGGLDARLLTSPNVSLLPGFRAEELAARVSSVVTVATPHLGTPLAFFFNSLLGQKLLYMISISTIYALRFGKFPLSTLFSLVGVITRLDDVLGLRNTILDQFYENLLADFDGPALEDISVFLDSIREDQALLGQLTPGGIDLLNATTEDRPGVRYGCVVTQARIPSFAAFRDIGLHPYWQGSHLIYRLLYWLTSLVPAYPEPSEETKEALRVYFGELPPPGANDGVVPTWSQVHGRVIHAAWADHLDVCGHFSDSKEDTMHIDWLSSNTQYTRAKFEKLWFDVVEFIRPGPEEEQAEV